MITATNTILLTGLRDKDNADVWDQFSRRYQPLLVAFGRRLGLREQDAQDAAQETLMAFCEAYQAGKYDRDKGRLRTWLLGIATKKIRYMQRKAGRERALGQGDDQTGLIDGIPDDHTISELWEAQWQDAILKACLEQVRHQVEPQTMRAFELFALHEWPADKVAEQLRMSRNAVFKAKRRVVSRLREAFDYLQHNW